MNNSDMPAMPTRVMVQKTHQVQWSEQSPGLSKREYFAGLAMQALITGRAPIEVNDKTIGKTIAQVCAEQSIDYANALLEALDKAP